MQTYQKHKFLVIFNLILVLAFLAAPLFNNLAYNHDGGGTIHTWIVALVISEILIVPIVRIVGSFRHKNSSQVQPVQARDSRVTGVGILLGAVVGIAGSVILVENGGTDAGLLIGVYLAIFVPLGAFLGYVFTKILFGQQHQKTLALKLFLIVAFLIAAILGYSYYDNKYGQKYCDGTPVQSYTEPLPPYCQ